VERQENEEEYVLLGRTSDFRGGGEVYHDRSACRLDGCVYRDLGARVERWADNH